MQFIYVFGLMFLAIFGAAMLAELFWKALFRSSLRSVDVYVKPSEDLSEFVEQARKSGFVGEINIVGGEENEQARALAERYDNVHLCADMVKKIDRE